MASAGIDNNVAENAIRPFMVEEKTGCSLEHLKVLMPAPPFTALSKLLRLIDLSITVTCAICLRNCLRRHRTILVTCCRKTFHLKNLSCPIWQVGGVIPAYVYLLIAYLNFKAQLGASMQQILRVLQLNLFQRCALADLFRPPDKQQPVSPQLLLWEKL